jgi:polyisoprenoid-binding protein YceI
LTEDVSPDYLDVEKYPTMTYHSTGIRQAEGGDWVIDSELTLHGVTRPVPLALEVLGFGTDRWGGQRAGGQRAGGQRAGFSATARISRRDFGIGWADGVDAGGAAVADKVSVNLDIEAVLQQ